MGHTNTSPRDRDDWDTSSRGTVWTQMIEVLLDSDHPDREQIWRGFFGRYQQLITQCMRARLREEGKQDRAEEFVGEFVSYLGTGGVLRTADRSRGRFRCYLQGAIRNFVRDKLRSERRSLQVGPDGLASIPARDDGIREFEREHDKAYVVELLLESLGRLHARNPKRAMAVVMRYGIECGFSSASQQMCSTAIAGALGLDSDSTARNYVADGIAQLRSLLRHAIGETVHGRDKAEYDAAYVDERAVVEARIEEVYPGLLSGSDHG